MTYCLDPLSPTSEELMRYALDGEPLSELSQNHVDTCPICQKRSSTLATANIFLVSHLYRSQCPQPMELANYCSSLSSYLLSDEEQARIAQHISECPLCSNEAKSFRSELETFSGSTLSHLLATPDRIPVYTFSAPATVKRLVATLQTQRFQLVTRNTKNEPGNNSTGDPTWPKHYKAEALDISLHLSRNNNGEIMLLGLFTSTDLDQDISAFEGCTVDLFLHPAIHEEQARQNGHAPKALISTTIDDLGNIVFKAVPPGTYTMLVHLPGTELTIEGIVIDSK